MKILFISPGRRTCDYLRDMLFHGLRSLGEDVTDVERLDVMYSDFPDISQLYGRGFTLYGQFTEGSVDRSDLMSKLKHRHFALIIYGSIHRDQSFLDEVRSMYPPSRVVFIDGEDHPQQILITSWGLYFKRELYNPQPKTLPIHFAIPASKIRNSPPPKTRLMAPLDPLSKATYIYKDEASYYQQYAESFYAATMKKAGYDCLRHYEILSQWSLPYFRGVESVPSTIMTWLPRPQLSLVRQAIELLGDRNTPSSYELLDRLWETLINEVMPQFREQCTTEALAKYVLDCVKGAA